MADFTTKNVDFTNGRPYNQAEHRRALDSCWGSYVNNGLDFTGNASTCTLTAGSGICKGYPFQFTGTYSVSKSGTYYVYVKITATIQNDNSGTATASIVFSRGNLSDSISNESNQTLYFKLYKIVNGVVDTDYRHQQTLKSVKLKETSDQWGLTVNGVDSNLINKPNATLPSGITEYERNNWITVNSGIYGGKTITFSSGTNLWDYDMLGLSYNEEPCLWVDLTRMRATGNAPAKGSTTTTGYKTTTWGGKMDAETVQYYVITLTLYKERFVVNACSVLRIGSDGKVTSYVNSQSWALNKYCLLKRKY